MTIEFFEPVSYVAARVAAPNVVASAAPTGVSATERVRLVVLP